jgi:hypothetical protein
MTIFAVRNNLGKSKFLVSKPRFFFSLRCTAETSERYELKLCKVWTMMHAKFSFYNSRIPNLNFCFVDDGFNRGWDTEAYDSQILRVDEPLKILKTQFNWRLDCWQQPQIAFSINTQKLLLSDKDYLQLPLIATSLSVTQPRMKPRAHSSNIPIAKFKRNFPLSYQTVIKMQRK